MYLSINSSCFLLQSGVQSVERVKKLKPPRASGSPELKLMKKSMQQKNHSLELELIKPRNFILIGLPRSSPTVH